MRGSGREKGFDFGLGNGLFGVSDCTDVSLIVGAAIDMDGTSGALVGGIDELSFTWIEGVFGATLDCDGTIESVAFVRQMLGVADCGGNALLDSSCFNSTSFGFQSASKLTIGRPGLSLTTVGIGNFGLRSFSLMLVAFRMSSPRISTPFLIAIVAPVGLASLSLAPPAELGGVGGRWFTT